MAKKNQDNTQQDTGTELALFPKLNLPSVTGITEEMNKSFGTMYTRIEAGIAELPTDMSIEANRRKVASYAYSISRTKTGLDEAAAGVSGDAKLIVDAVNKERKELKTTLDALRDKAREKLDAWEMREREREHATQTTIARLVEQPSECIGQTSVFIADTIGDIAAEIYCEEIFGEQGAAEVEAARKETLQRLEVMRAERIRYEEEQAELEQFRREKAEREAAEAARKAEEERKAAEEAEAARQAAERARIAQEAEEKAKRDAAEAIEREKREKEAAEQRAKEAEAREAQRIEDEKRRAIEQEEQRKEAAARAEEEAKRREAAAAEAERQRIARERAAKEQADAERAADLAHRKSINAAAVAALVKLLDVNETFAQQIIVAVYKGQIPHISINY